MIDKEEWCSGENVSKRLDVPFDAQQRDLLLQDIKKFEPFDASLQLILQ